MISLLEDICSHLGRIDERLDLVEQRLDRLEKDYAAARYARTMTRHNDLIRRHELEEEGEDE